MASRLLISSGWTRIASGVPYRSMTMRPPSARWSDASSSARPLRASLTLTALVSGLRTVTPSRSSHACRSRPLASLRGAQRRHDLRRAWGVEHDARWERKESGVESAAPAREIRSGQSGPTVMTARTPRFEGAGRLRGRTQTQHGQVAVTVSEINRERCTQRDYACSGVAPEVDLVGRSLTQALVWAVRVVPVGVAAQPS